MGYTDQDWKAINTIRTLAVSSSPSQLNPAILDAPPSSHIVTARSLVWCRPEHHNEPGNAQFLHAALQILM